MTLSVVKPRTFWIVGIIAVFVLAILTALPIGAARILEGMLRDRGATEVSIEDMDINLFAGTLAFYDVVAANGTGRMQVDTLEVEASLWSIFSSRVEILELNLTGGHLDLIEGQDGIWQLGSLRLEAGEQPAEPVDAEPAPPWGLGAHRLNIEDFTLTLQSEQLVREFELQRLSVERAFSWQPQDSLALELVLLSGEAELDLTVEATPFHETLAISGDLELRNLLVENIRNPTLAAALEDLAGTVNLELDFNVKLTPGSALDLELSGDLSLQDAAFADKGAQVGLDEVEWRGGTTAAIDLSDEAAPVSVALTGEINLANLRVSDVGEDLALFSLGGLDVQGIRVTEQLTTIAAVTLTDLQANIHRLPDGALRLPGNLAASAGAPEMETETEIQATPAGTAYVARIDQLMLAGDNQFFVRDEAVDPVFTADLNLAELRMSDIDTAGTQPLSINLVASTSDTDSLQVAGTVAPFVKQLSADLQVDLEGVDLSRFSSYVPGYNLERGRMGLQSTSKVVDGELDIQNKIVIDKLKIAGKTDDEDALMATGAAMPLDVMLDLLRDSDDRIELEIPVTGNLASVDVGLNQVIRKATQTALQKASMAYVKTALQPLGTILFAAKLAGKAARPRFEPVEFAAGTSQPTGEHAEYTNKIAELLKNRPALGITLCGVATKQDELALTPVPEPTTEAAAPATQSETTPIEPAVSEETLLALAKTRADALKDSLVSRGVDAKQLFDCRASFEPTVNDLPRVEVML